MHVNIGTTQIENNNSKKLVGVHIDSKLYCERHINTICGKARAKINKYFRKSSTLYEYWETENYCECLFQFTVQLLSFNMEVL